MKLRAPPGPINKPHNIKLSNQPSPICDGTRKFLPQLSRPHVPAKMRPWSRNGDELLYMCIKCFKTEKVHEPVTKRPNSHK